MRAASTLAVPSSSFVDGRGHPLVVVQYLPARGPCPIAVHDLALNRRLAGRRGKIINKFSHVLNI